MASRYQCQEDIVDAVIRDLSDRSGLDFDSIDPQTMQDLRNDLFFIVEDILCKYLDEVNK